MMTPTRSRWTVLLGILVALAILLAPGVDTRVSADPLQPGDQAAGADDTGASPATEAEAKYPEIKAAFELLKEEIKTRKYDQTLAKLKEAKVKYGDELPYAELILVEWLFRLRDFAGAKEVAVQAAEAHDDLPPGNVTMAIMFLRFRVAAAARQFLEKAIQETPGDPEAYVMLGEMDLGSKLITEASLLLDKANTLLTTFTKSAKRKEKLQQRVLLGLARIAEAHAVAQAKDETKASEEWTKAKKYYENSLAIKSDNAAVMHRLAIVMFRLKEWDKVYPQLEKAHNADSRLPNPGTSMAELYGQAGDREQAKKWWDFALRADQGGNDLRTRLMACNWGLKTEQILWAKQQTDAALAIDPESTGALMLAGVVALWQQAYPDAEAYFTKAMLAQPDGFGPKNNLALALCEQADDAKKKLALQYATQNAQIFTKGANQRHALSTYGWVLYKARRVQDAAKALTQLIRLTGGQVEPDTAFYYSQVAYDLGQKDEAKRILENALNQKTPFSRRKDAEALLKKISQ